MGMRSLFAGTPSRRSLGRGEGRPARRHPALCPWGLEPLERRELFATFSGTVAGNANIFGAGKAQPPAPGGAGAGVSPLELDFAASSDQVLTFESVTGQVSCCGTSAAAFNGPDGGKNASGDTDITSYGGISGIIDPDRTIFLVGVFLASTPPVDPAPERLSFSDANDFSDLSPAIAQTFYIGDGHTASGSPQVFHVPAGATRLFLGFADALQFGNPTSAPGYYFDNYGSLAIQADLNAPLQTSQEAVPSLKVDGNVLKYGNGGTEPIRLIGYSDLGILDEWKPGKPTAKDSFLYNDFFNSINQPDQTDRQINFVRVWPIYPFDKSLSPFTIVEHRGRRRRRSSFELMPNPALLAHLHDFVAAAEAKGIIVQITLFTGSDQLIWTRSPYYNKHLFPSPEAWAKAGRNQTSFNAYFKPYINSVLGSLRDANGLLYRNVMIEIMNEPTEHLVDNRNDPVFHKSVVDAIRGYIKNDPTLSADGYQPVLTVNLGVDDGTHHPTDTALAQWALSSSSGIGVVSVHIADADSQVITKMYTGVAKPVIIGNDGDSTQSRVKWDATRSRGDKESGDELEKERTRITALREATFPDGAELGTMHFDFLDKDINGSSWIRYNWKPGLDKSHVNYDPRVSNIDTWVVAELSKSAPKKSLP
jgi:hypothetical protein